MPAYKIDGDNFDTLKRCVIEALESKGMTLEQLKDRIDRENIPIKKASWEVYWMTCHFFGDGWNLQDLYTVGMNSRDLYDSHIETAMRRIILGK